MRIAQSGVDANGEIRGGFMKLWDAAIAAIREARPRRVVVLTGAGISAESGVPTRSDFRHFALRGETGVWRTLRPDDIGTPAGFVRDPLLVWEWFEQRRSIAREALPNAAHRALAAMSDAAIVTQNVDDLHRKAGSKHVIELHGNLFRTRCVHEETTSESPNPFAQLPPRCTCGALLRPDTIWFGEALPARELERAAEVIRKADLMLVIGVSEIIFPASATSLSRTSFPAGLLPLYSGLSVDINPNSGAVSAACTFGVAATAVDATPPIVEAILESAGAV
jgi:NAD-dependent deacetylase